jgi:hypothetical protein
MKAYHCSALLVGTEEEVLYSGFYLETVSVCLFSESRGDPTVTYNIKKEKTRNVRLSFVVFV